MTKSHQLAKLAAPGAADAGPIGKLIAGAQDHSPAAPTEKAADDHDVHRLNLDFSLGSALEQIGEARRLTGAERRAKIERAMRYLGEELLHC